MDRRISLRDRRTGGFTLIELLVVISIILIVLAMSIPFVGALMKSSTLNNSGNIVKGAAMKARAKAIATRDVQYLLLFARRATYPVQSVTDDSLPPRPIRGSKGTIVIVDENARAGAARFPEWLQTVDEPISLPDHARFAFDGTNDVIELQFFSDGSLIYLDGSDKPLKGLASETEDDLISKYIGAGKETALAQAKHLAIINQSQSSACILEFFNNTGTCDHVTFPK